MPILKIQKLHSDARVPSYAHPGDAGMDLFSSELVTIKPRTRALIGTGVTMALPKGTVGLIWDKSGLANNNGLKVLGGVVDAGYRGEVKVGLVNLGTKEVRIAAGEKIAQMLIQNVHAVAIREVTSLAATKRGSGGFGSTGRR